MPDDRKPTWKASTVQHVWVNMSGHLAEPGSYGPVSALHMVNFDHMAAPGGNLLLVKSAHCLYLWQRRPRDSFTYRDLLRPTGLGPRNRRILERCG